MEKTPILAFLALLSVFLVIILITWPEQFYGFVDYIYGFVDGGSSGARPSGSGLDDRVAASGDSFITTLRLYEGWNLISTPLVLDDPDVSAVFTDLDYSIVYSWDASSGSWLYHLPGTGGNLTYIEVDKGYWIHVNENTALTLYGRAPYPVRNVSLAAGWNLVGFSGYNVLPLAAALEGVDHIYVYGWNTTRAFSNGVGWSFNSIYGRSVYSTPPKPQLMKDSGFTDAGVLTVMEQGRGYWVYVENEQYWTYETGYPT